VAHPMLTHRVAGECGVFLNTMKTSAILSLAAIGVLSLTAQPTYAVPHQFAGTFTYTFTQLWERADEYSPWVGTTSIPGLNVGDSFSGVYGYMAETGDGAFGAWATTALEYESFYAEGVGVSPVPFPALNFPNYYNGAILVEAGHVTAAQANHQVGPYIVHAGLAWFEIVDNNYGGNLYVGEGTIQWSDPRRVPETGATIALFAFALGLVATLRRCLVF
jgi:hypothetical protein